MVKCPNCGSLIEKNSRFCQECGTKIEKPKNSTKGYEKNKKYALIALGYLTVLIVLISVLSAALNVKVINSDRLLLYPLLSFMMSVYVSLKLINNEETFKHGVIVPIVSFIIFLFGI
jgi:predicted amidophosphoribosyltransferase